jgi:hypothetical protein
MAFHIQIPKAMVKSIAILFLSVITANAIHSQETGKDINDFVYFSTILKDDTLNYHDTLEVIVEMSNITEDTITFYPEGIVYLRLSYTDYQKELFLISDRKTYKKEKQLLPYEKIVSNYEVVIEKDIFQAGANEFSLIFISYPYWLMKKDRSKSIFGKWESEIKRIIVL